MLEPQIDVAPTARSAAQIRAWLVAELARALRTQEHLIDTTAPLHETGADSVTAFQLTGALADWLQRDIPVSLAWEYGSIDAIAEALGTP